MDSSLSFCPKDSFASYKTFSAHSSSLSAVRRITENRESVRRSPEPQGVGGDGGEGEETGCWVLTGALPLNSHKFLWGLLSTWHLPPQSPAQESHMTRL